MDDAKCRALKLALASQQPQLVPIERFFDGNDDPASIGCNLAQHPGMNVFRDVLEGLRRRTDVDAVYAQISELDPGEGSWPFTDTVVVVGQISAEDLRTAVSALEPDDVFPSAEMPLGSAALAVWWD